MNHFFISILFLFSLAANAEHYYYQVPEPSFFENGLIQFRNKSKQASFVDLFLMTEESKVMKQRIHLEGLESLEMPSKNLFTDENSKAYFFVDISNKEGVNVSMGNSKVNLPMPKNTGVQYSIRKKQEFKIHNFSAIPAIVTLYNIAQQETQSFQLKAFSSKKIINENQAVLLSTSQPSLLSYPAKDAWQFLSPQKHKLPKKQGSAYFLLSSNSNSPYSFVIELKDPDKIQQARQHLKQDSGKEYHIVNGKISVNDLSNLQTDSSNTSAWSWKLTDIEFSKFGGNFCNLHSLEIEINLKKLLEIDARACNWEFRILKEL